MTLEDQVIEEAAYIWLHERDDVPCSIRRARLRQMCVELAAVNPIALMLDRNRSAETLHWPMPDRQMMAANDDTFHD